MKAVSVHQPFAFAILHLGKSVENRSWRTHHRGPLLIHASKTRTSYDRVAPDFAARYGAGLPDWDSLPTRAVVGVADVVDCIRSDQRADDKWAEKDCWCWVLANPRAFSKAIPFAGAQLFFEVPDELVAGELSRLAGRTEVALPLRIDRRA